MSSLSTGSFPVKSIVCLPSISLHLVGTRALGMDINVMIPESYGCSHVVVECLPSTAGVQPPGS